VYVLFTIISPIIRKVTKIDISDIDYEKYFEETDTYQIMSENLSNNNDKSVEEIYISNLKQDMKNKLKEQGYIAQSIDIKIDTSSENDYGRIEEISLSIYKDKEGKQSSDTEAKNTININKVEEVKIGNTIKSEEDTANVQDINVSQKNEIKEYLSSVYDVNKKNIKINE